jgi:hypothetical protein
MKASRKPSATLSQRDLSAGPQRGCDGAELQRVTLRRGLKDLRIHKWNDLAVHFFIE